MVPHSSIYTGKPNAVAVNSTSFVLGQMIGPAIAGLVIAKIGTGWAFLLNGLSFGAVLLSMSLLRVQELRANARASRKSGGFIEGLRYVWAREDLRSILVMLFLIGTFGLNFPIFISTMAVKVFHANARGFGLLSSMMAIGTMSGALLSAGRDKPGFGTLFLGSGVFGTGCMLATFSPGSNLSGSHSVTILAALSSGHEFSLATIPNGAME